MLLRPFPSYTNTQDDEVTIEIHAAALNFRDVMIALSLCVLGCVLLLSIFLPHDALSPPNLSPS